MTARKFLDYCDIEVTDKNLYKLSQWLEYPIDFSQFPDANLENDTDIFDLRVQFQEHMG